MLIITVHVNAPLGLSQGIKEQIVEDLERFGDAKVVSIEERSGYQQMEIGGPHEKR